VISAPSRSGFCGWRGRCGGRTENAGSAGMIEAYLAGTLRPLRLSVGGERKPGMMDKLKGPSPESLRQGREERAQNRDFHLAAIRIAGLRCEGLISRPDRIGRS